MPRIRNKRHSGEHGEFWPGYVDMLSTILLVFTFLLSILMLAQYVVTYESNNKNIALRRLNSENLELKSMLSMEKQKYKWKHKEIKVLRAAISKSELEIQKYKDLAKISGLRAQLSSSKAFKLSSELNEQREISVKHSDRVVKLNQQLTDMKSQITKLSSALKVSEERTKKAQAQVVSLGARLDLELARKIEELKSYRSDFFGRLRTLLQNRRDIRIVGDRFIFQSEVLFPSGQAKMLPQGYATLDKLADAILKLSDEIPEEINWIIQVDGHTDIKPISSSNFPSNWELSTGRAISVVRYLISRGVPPERLVAAGYGEFQPLSLERTIDGLRRNRRIEFKLTNR